jgi:glycosyltransferase involved in cell wall biosynthesis
VNLESPLPATLPAGTATALYCSGTASDGVEPVSGFEFVVDGEQLAADAWRMPRFDVACRRSGFWGVVPVRAAPGASSIELGAQVQLSGGGEQRVTLGRIEVSAAAAKPADDHGQGLIAICMGTFDPDPGLFAAQVESLRAQTDRSWVCVISDDHSSPERFDQLRSIVGDDERFVVSRCEERIGFYRNFERALLMAPAEADLIALCDQDDVWHPDKLAVLRASLGSATLVYSDQRLVDPHGRVLRDTLWRGRRNNHTNIASMLMANTVTGAASLFRREVLELALPFPDSPGLEFHDHWIALVALATGELAYVDRPLYDYVQHSGAILGKVTEPGGRVDRRVRLRLPRMRAWRAAYFFGYVPGQVRAQTLLLRGEHRLTPGKRRALRRYLSVDSSVVGLAWLLLRPARLAFGRTETLGGEWELLPGVVWRRLAGLIAAVPGWPDQWLLDTRFPQGEQFEHRRLRRWRERT